MNLTTTSRLTPEQQNALAIDRDIVLQANAGSGKTTVLADRIAFIILPPENTICCQNGGQRGGQCVDYWKSVNIQTKPSEIAAITFTKKAAAEMKHKVADKINKAIVEEKCLCRISALKSLNERFIGLRLSTIHSFCSDIIKKNPIEAEVSTNFKELSETDKSKMLKDAVLYAVESVLDFDNQTLDENSFLTAEDKQNFETILLNNGIDKVVNTLIGILQNKELTVSIFNLYFTKSGNGENILKSESEIISQFTKSSLSLIFTIIKLFFTLQKEKLEQQKEVLIDAKTEATRKKNTKTLDEIKELVARICEFNPIDYSFDELNELIKLIAALKTKKLGRSIYYNLLTSKDEKQSFLEMTNDKLLNLFGIGSKDIENLIDDLNDEQIRNSILTVKLLAIASDYFENEKREREVLDFDDMILAANKALDKAVAGNYKLEGLNYKFLFIDEYQDTNRLQYEMVKKIATKLQDPKNATLSKDDMKLFIVGDPKQSIYGFRNADVSVFLQTQEDINAINIRKIEQNLIDNNLHLANGEKITLEDTNNNQKILNGLLDLTISFRLHQNLSAFVNEACEPLFTFPDSISKNNNYSKYKSWGAKSEDLDFLKLLEIEYSNFVVGKKYSEEVLTNHQRVNFLSYIESAKQTDNSDESGDIKQTETTLENEDESDGDEAKAVALAIKNNVIGKFILSNGLPATAKDLAVLGRNRKILNSIQLELEQIGVPFINESGIGYFQSMEMLDIISLFAFIVDSGDDFSLASFLRSPFIGMTSQEIYALINHKKENRKIATLFESLQDLAAKNVSNAINAQYTLCKALLDYSIRSNPASLLSYAIDNTLLRFNSEDKQKYKVSLNRYLAAIETIINWQTKGLSNHKRILRELIDKNEISIEGEKQIDTNAEAVKLLTIHSSKGLGFPIVIFVGTNARAGGNFNENISYTINEKTGFLIDYLIQKNYQNENASLNEKPFNIIKAANKYINTRKEDEENKRLLYVALTRTEEYLIISSKIKQNKVKNEMEPPTFQKPSGFLKQITSSLENKHSDFYQTLVKQIYNSTSNDWETAVFGELKSKIEFYDIPTNIPKDIKLKFGILNGNNIINNANQDSNLESNTAEENDNTLENTKTQQKTEYKLLLESPEFPEIKELYSPTKLTLINHSPTAFQMRSVFGLSETYKKMPGDLTREKKDREDIESPGEDEIKGAYFGTLVHKALAEMPTYMDSNGKIDLKKFDKMLEELEEDFSKRYEMQNYTQKVKEECLRVLETEFIRKNSDAILFGLYSPNSEKQKTQFEFGLRVPVDKDILYGEMDLIFTNAENEIEIWDWKTNRIDLRNSQQFAEIYEIQMKCYAYLAAHYYADSQIFNCRLISTFNAAKNRPQSEWSHSFRWTRQQILEFKHEFAAASQKMKAIYAMDYAALK